MVFQFLKRFCCCSEEKIDSNSANIWLQSTQVQGFVLMSVLPNTEREFPPRETPFAHYSRVMHRAWRVIVWGKLTSLMLDDKYDDEGWIRQKSSSDAVLQSARCVGLCACWSFILGAPTPFHVITFALNQWKAAGVNASDVTTLISRIITEAHHCIL